LNSGFGTGKGDVLNDRRPFLDYIDDFLEIDAKIAGKG
jgi:hypothetical protein